MDGAKKARAGNLQTRNFLNLGPVVNNEQELEKLEKVTKRFDTGLSLDENNEREWKTSVDSPEPRSRLCEQ